MDFPHTFVVILPSVTWTPNNSNLQLTRSNFSFPSDHFYTIVPSITRTMFLAGDKWRKKVSCIPKHISKRSCILCLYLFWQANSKTMFNHFYLLRTPDNSNFFSISLEGSSYLESQKAPENSCVRAAFLTRRLFSNCSVIQSRPKQLQSEPGSDGLQKNILTLRELVTIISKQYVVITEQPVRGLLS